MMGGVMDWWIDESLPAGPKRKPPVRRELVCTPSESERIHTEQHGLGDLLYDNDKFLGLLIEIEIITKFWGGERTVIYKYDTWDEEDW